MLCWGAKGKGRREKHGYMVVGLRHVNDRFLVEGEGVPIESPVPAVNLQKTRK